MDKDQRSVPSEQFAAKVNAKLAISRAKDVFIYLHGYKVVFENPLLVASELWHFLGYEGVFIAFAWPSTPRPWLTSRIWKRPPCRQVVCAS